MVCDLLRDKMREPEDFVPTHVMYTSRVLSTCWTPMRGRLLYIEVAVSRFSQDC